MINTDSDHLCHGLFIRQHDFFLLQLKLLMFAPYQYDNVT
jgi:hypothetical protein